ncbi:MAG: PH domain-containing protein [Pirellulales bacterium]
MLAAARPIAGVTPPEEREVTVMTVFPTLAAYPPGRLMGRLCAIQAGFGFFSLGKLFALLLIPFAVGLFAFSLLPFVIRRYSLTNRRVIIQKGLRAIDERWVDFDRFDAVDIEVLPGQEWFPAGDLIFRMGPIETFRLAGVSRPETFRHTCLAARRGYLGARESS